MVIIDNYLRKIVRILTKYCNFATKRLRERDMPKQTSLIAFGLHCPCSVTTNL